MSGRTLAAVAAEAVEDGAKTINLVGGEPSLHAHTILAAAAASERPRAWVLNSNMMMTPRVIEWLSGVVGLYLGDFKYGNDRCAEQLSGAKDYWRIVTRNLRLAAGAGRVLVRHLVLPGHVDCCFRPVAAWVAEHLAGAGFHVMFSYMQGAGSWSEGELGRLVSPAEVSAARGWLEELGLAEYEQATT